MISTEAIANLDSAGAIGIIHTIAARLCQNQGIFWGQALSRSCINVAQDGCSRRLLKTVAQEELDNSESCIALRGSSSDLAAPDLEAPDLAADLDRFERLCGSDDGCRGLISIWAAILHGFASLGAEWQDS
ncbi:MAG: hypothetical protein WBA57_08615 [Elainellaceae cyanobacterium]